MTITERIEYDRLVERLGEFQGLLKAAQYFMEHSIPPFTGDKWTRENRLVIGEALAALD